MGNCEKSAYYERSKALEAKEKESSCFNSAKVQHQQQQPSPTYQEVQKDSLENAPQSHYPTAPPQNITKIVEQNRRTTDEASSQKENGGLKNECKLISNYGNPCDHPQCAEVMNTSALLSPSNKKITQTSVVLRDFENEGEGH